MILGTHSILEGLSEASIMSSSHQAGFGPTNVVRGDLAAAPFRAASTASFVDFFFNLNFAPLRLVGVFGVRPIGVGTTPLDISVAPSGTWPHTFEGTLYASEVSFNSRGDCWIALPEEIAPRSIRVRINTGFARLEVGKVWAGQMFDGAAPRSVQRSLVGGYVRNASEARSFSTSRIATDSCDLEMAWPALTPDEEAALTAALASGGNGERRAMLVPDERKDPTSVYLGYLHPSYSVEWDTTRLRQGMSMRFSEEGRALG